MSDKTPPPYHSDPVIAEMYERMCVDIMNKGFLEVLYTTDTENLLKHNQVELVDKMYQCKLLISSIQTIIGLE